MGRDDSGEYEPVRTRKRTGIPNWAILAALGGFVVVCGGGTLAFVLSGAAAKVKQARDESTLRPAPGEEVRVGDIGVTVVDCREGHVSSVSPSGRELDSNRPFTVVTLRLKNYNPAKNASPQGQSSRATVTDDLGNVLKRVRTKTEVGLESSVYGQIEDGKSLVLRSDGDGSDKLVVQRAVPAAKSVTVVLDATCYGGRGDIVVVVPITK